MNYQLIKEHVNKSTNVFDWSIDSEGNFCTGDFVFKLTPWRYNFILRAVWSLSVEANSLNKICSYKAIVVQSKNADIEELLYGELDTCQWLLDDKIKTVYALSTPQTISVVLKTEKGIIGSIDIATTLSDQSTPVTRHEIVGEEGVISDRSINERIPSMPTYVFTDDKKEPATYADLDLYVDGLSPDETYVFENIKALANSQELIEESAIRHKKLMGYVKSVYKSIKNGTVEKVEG